MSNAFAILPAVPNSRNDFQGLIGHHPLMLALFYQIQTAARLQAPIVIHGETGTGKELVAQALGKLSSRDGKIVSVNLSEISESLIESTLFGSVRGAFTGAVDRCGLLEEASGGILYLDEAGDLPKSVQLKLLRVLETRMVRRLGGLQERPALFRLILCVQDSTEELVATGRWRADFRFRVDAITLRIPPLRSRPSDICLLVDHFLEQLGHSALGLEGLEPLLAHSWPGNVREVLRVVERAVFAAGSGQVRPHHLSCQMNDPDSHALPEHVTELTLRQRVEDCLTRAGNRSSIAAGMLGLSLPTFYRRLRELGLRPPRFR
jgi:DNA-binding NtrC family response regulator